MGFKDIDEQKFQDMIITSDRFGVASYIVDKFFMDLIDGINEKSVNNAFDAIGLNRVNIENSCIKINELVNPIEPEQLGHRISKKLIYKSILVNIWEKEMPDNLEELL